MQLLKNERDWKKFSKEDHTWHAPKNYPCYVYLVVESFAYERDQTMFLYPDDVFKMAIKLRAEIG